MNKNVDAFLFVPDFIGFDVALFVLLAKQNSTATSVVYQQCMMNYYNYRRFVTLITWKNMSEI